MTTALQFRAMGSDAQLIVVGAPPRVAEEAKRRVDDLERRWSRFLPSSEVSRLTRHAGSPVPVSAETTLLVRRAVEAWRITGGSFDPTVLGAMIRAGYDRSFERLGRSPRAGASPLATGCSDIQLAGTTVRLPAGTGFDPGGIGKGLAADIVAEEVMDAGAAGVCVNLGGDVRVCGASPRGDSWTVSVEHPWLAEPLACLGLADGAVATSTTLRRRWKVDEDVRHHLIDPATGLPSGSDLTLVSVVTSRGWTAEILSKAVLLRGSAHPFDILGGTGAQAIAVDERGRVQATAGLGAFLGPGIALAPALAAPTAGVGAACQAPPSQAPPSRAAPRQAPPSRPAPSRV